MKNPQGRSISSDGKTPLEGLRILIIDDNLALRNMFRNLLQQFRPESVDVVRDGRLALSRLLLDEIPAPHIILCNLHNAGMDGMKFCNAVRRDIRLRQRRIPILVLTAEQNPLVHEVLRQIGVRAVLGKPVSMATLLEHIGLEVAGADRNAAPTRAAA